MAKLSDLTAGNYLTGGQILGQQIPVTLERIEVEKMPDNDDGPGKQKHVAYFVGKTKGVVLNKTNLNVLMEMGLVDTEVIPAGFNLILYSEKVAFQGRMVDGLRMRPSNSHVQPDAQQAPPPPIEDDVPF